MYDYAGGTVLCDTQLELLRGYPLVEVGILGFLKAKVDGIAL